MPRGTERTLIYVRERDAQGRVVIHAVVKESPSGEPSREEATRDARLSSHGR